MTATLTFQEMLLRDLDAERTKIAAELAEIPNRRRCLQRGHAIGSLCLACRCCALHERLDAIDRAKERITTRNERLGGMS